MPEWGQSTNAASGGEDAPGVVRGILARLLALADLAHGGTVGPDGAATPDGAPEDVEIRREVRAIAGAGDGAMRRLAHEARQNLTVIKGRAQLLRRRALAAPTADLVLLRGLEEIDRAVDRMERLIADHLDPADGDGRPGGTA